MFVISKKIRNFANHYPPYMKTCVGGGKMVNSQLVTNNSKFKNSINQ